MKNKGIDGILDEIIGMVTSVICESDKAPKGLRLMAKLSVLSSMLPDFGSAMNRVEMNKRCEFDEMFDKVAKSADVLIEDLKGLMDVLPCDKKDEEDENVDDSEGLENGEKLEKGFEDRYGLRFLGK